MSSIFKKIKSAFVIEEGHPVDPPATTKVPTSTENKVAAEETGTLATTNQLEIKGEKGQINQKFTDILLKALEANNQEGFDYIEFKRSLQNLFKMNLDEITVYKSAYATAQTLGATPKGLIASAHQYLAVLQKEEDKFKLALSNQRAKQIEGGLLEIQQYEQSILEKQKLIKKLEEEIGELEAKRSSMQAAVQESTQKIESTGSDFVASYDSLVSQIKQDIENIGKYLN